MCLHFPYGSSPLTRGKRSHRHSLGGLFGLIPAHAGKTRFAFACHVSCPAHPRSRGENHLGITTCTPHPGSSPLTRGKHRLGRTHREARGLIPAHAGKTAVEVLPVVDLRAHPRSRGENCVCCSWHLRAQGSSPLTRGKPLDTFTEASVRGLIPAHAGKTSPSMPLCGCAAAHPRSRGENENPPLDSSNPHGSSPLTRGKLGRRVKRWRLRGLIPAHAGKTSLRAILTHIEAAHPRSRGENPMVAHYLGVSGGSSPLTRGKRSLADHQWGLRGLIPAHAGKTCETSASPKPGSAHPRSRGENKRRTARRPDGQGSSPLTRGKHGRGR